VKKADVDPATVLEIVGQLVEHGVDVNYNHCGNEKGLKPSHGAAFLGYRQMAEFLLAHGAELDTRTYGNASPLLIAVVARTKEAISF